MTPTVNVNLKPCDALCSTRRRDDAGCIRHRADCAAAPVPLPLSLQPFRSVTFEVALGACDCPRPGQSLSCPARPVRVSFHVECDTWETSEVTEVEAVPGVHDGMGRGDALYERCRDRWALVKALVLGVAPPLTGTEATDLPLMALLDQRDAVFAALAAMARGEESHEAHRRALFAACPAIFPKGGVSPRPNEDRPSVRNLAAYVEHLIEQVGVLP